MNLQLNDKAPTLDVPKVKAIFIDGREMGDVTPELCGTEIRWHAVIRLATPCGGPAAGLAQGFGNTPEKAIADSIVSARRASHAFAKSIAAVESSLGVADKTSEQLAKEPQ